MAYTFDDLDELDDFIVALAYTGGTSRFRGTEVRCNLSLGARHWTIYGPNVTKFTADIGPDDLDYAREKLMAAGLLDTPRA